MKTIKVLSLVAVSLFVSSASAVSLYMEPLVGGQFSGQLKTSSTDKASFSTYVYGGRIGLDLHSFVFGAEYMGDKSVSVKFDAPNTWGSSSTTGTMSNNNYGAFIGLDLLSSLRLIGTFFIKSDANVTHSTSGTQDLNSDLSGYGYKGELSIRVLSHLSLGLSYYYTLYTKQKDNINNTSSAMVPVGNVHAVMATVSVPFGL